MRWGEEDEKKTAGAGNEKRACVSANPDFLLVELRRIELLTS